jgi:hypothetical protein
MKIKIKTTIDGATSALGNSTMSYEEGNTYDMNEDWSKEIALVWISMDVAEELVSTPVKEVKVVKPVEKKVIKPTGLK